MSLRREVVGDMVGDFFFNSRILGKRTWDFLPFLL